MGRALLPVACALLALGPLCVGLVLGFSSPTSAALVAEGVLSHAHLGLFEAFSPLGAMPGGFAAGWTSDRAGRRAATALAACLPLALGWALVASASGSTQLCLGRLLTGFGQGGVLNAVPVFMAEIAPTSSRGALLGFSQLFINAGIVLAFALGGQTLGPSLSLSWRRLAWLSAAPPLLLALCCPLLPESPRWLALNGRSDEAGRSLKRLRGGKADFSAELRGLKDSWEHDTSSPRHSRHSALRQLMEPPMLAPLRLVLAFHVAQQVCGINALNYNMASIFREAGLRSASLAALVVAAVQVPVSVAACFLLDRTGRRPLLMGSCLGTGLAALAMGVAFSLPSGQGAHLLAVVGALGFRTSFSLGLGPIPWVLSGELLPETGRGLASAVVVCANSLSNVAVTVSFGTMKDFLGMGGSFFLYALASLSAAYYAQARLPETSGRTLEQTSRPQSESERDDAEWAGAGGVAMGGGGLTRAVSRRGPAGTL